MLPLVSGCRNVVEFTNTRKDEAYLRSPGQQFKTEEITEGSLFPMATGSHWQMHVQGGDKQSTEDITVVGPIQIGENAGIALQMSHNGKPDRQEVYRSDKKGLLMVAAGTPNDRMTLSPPLPLLHLPIKEGETISWSGVLHYRDTAAPGTALSRISGRSTVKTPAGSFDSYRVDTIINTTVQGQQVAFPTTRWFSPGVGMVKQKLLAGQTVVIKEMIRYDHKK